MSKEANDITTVTIITNVDYVYNFRIKLIHNILITIIKGTFWLTVYLQV